MSTQHKDGQAKVFASATSGGAVTASDTTVLDFTGIWIGGAGDVAVLHEEDGTAVTYPGAVAGSVLPVSGVRVMSTNTTATSMVWMKW